MHPKLCNGARLWSCRRGVQTKPGLWCLLRLPALKVSYDLMEDDDVEEPAAGAGALLAAGLLSAGFDSAGFDSPLELSAGFEADPLAAFGA